MANWIINPDKSIYHLKVRKEDLATTILTVGDPERVSMVCSRFDKIETVKQSREFKTVTGYLGKKRISVISSGIGTDNIDIVLNEIDYLFNINEDGSPKSTTVSLDLIRLGTSGAIQKDIPVDQLLLSHWSLQAGGIFSFYQNAGPFRIALNKALGFDKDLSIYAFEADDFLLKKFSTNDFLIGNTLTCNGFYGPQGRSTRIEENDMLSKWEAMRIAGIGKINNLEMETSGIYGMSKLLGHRALSINAILANRITNQFSNQAEKTISKMIDKSLELLLGF